MSAGPFSAQYRSKQNSDATRIMSKAEFSKYIINIFRVGKLIFKNIQFSEYDVI